MCGMVALDAYLVRIGCDGPRGATLDARCGVFIDQLTARPPDGPVERTTLDADAIWAAVR